MNQEFDVAIVGGGPGGSVSAKRCAQEGLKTVLLEKNKLPRNKVCTGMIMSTLSQKLVKEEFGDAPKEVLTNPSYLMGIKFHAPATKTLTFEHKMPFAWRKDLDFWMNQSAQRAGAAVWDKARIKEIVEDEKGYILRIEKDSEIKRIRARFLIGADGTLSIVRKALFPNSKMEYQLCVRYCYQRSLELNPEYAHYFYLNESTVFEINHKDNVFLLEVTPRSHFQNGSKIRLEAEDWLTRDFNFTSDSRPLWRDGCFEPSMVRRRFSGAFPLATNNALLVGNAAGLSKPITGEGIGTALKSGLMAAEAVVQANRKGGKADHFYMPMAYEMISILDRMYPPHGKIRGEARKGIDYFLTTIKEIYSGITGIL